MDETKSIYLEIVRLCQRFGIIKTDYLTEDELLILLDELFKNIRVAKEEI